MRYTLICLAGVALLAACSKKPADAGKESAAAPATGPAAATAPAATPAAAPAAAVSGSSVAGTYTANGKAATLTSVSAHPDEPFSGQPVTKIVITAQDHSADPKADFNASFGRFGDAIILSAHPDGSLIGTEILHSGLKQEGAISWIGTLKLLDYRTSGGQISGHLTSGGPADVFGQPVQVDLTFHTPAP